MRIIIPPYTADAPVSAPDLVSQSSEALVISSDSLEAPVHGFSDHAAPPHSSPPLVRTFHMDFAAPSNEDDVILISESGTRFHTSLHLLAGYSTFFKGLAALPTTNIRAQPPLLELPSATTDALAAALTLITPGKNIDWLVAQSLSYDGAAFGRIIQELCELADAYDFEDILAFLPIRLDHSPWLRFALAAVADDEQAAVAFSKETVNLNIADITVSAQAVLERLGVDRFARLRTLHETRKKAWDRFVLAVKHTQVASNGFNDFGIKCRRRFSVGCAGYALSGGSFTRLRKIAADAAFAAMTGLPRDRGLYAPMRDAVYAAIPCQSCATRLSEPFRTR